MQRRAGKINQRKIAEERIKILFDKADCESLNSDFEQANRYVDAARKIAMKYNVRIKSGFKRKFCKFCHHYLLPAETASVRLDSREHRVVIKCFKCKRMMFYPYTREIKMRRREKVSAVNQ